MRRLIPVSLMPRSRRIGATSRARICRSMKLETYASVSTATTYQEYRAENAGGAGDGGAGDGGAAGRGPPVGGPRGAAGPAGRGTVRIGGAGREAGTTRPNMHPAGPDRDHRPAARTAARPAARTAARRRAFGDRVAALPSRPP